MKTCTIEEIKQNCKQISKTVETTREEKEDTERISYTKVVKKEKLENGEMKQIDFSSDFAFEKERVKAITNTQLFISLNTTLPNLVTPDKTGITFAGKEYDFSDDKDAQKKRKEGLAKTIKTLSIIQAIYCALDILMAFSLILYISINNTPLGEFLLWLSMEIVLDILLLIISFKGSNASEFDLLYANSYLKWLLIFGICLIALIVGVVLQRNIQESLKCAISQNEYYQKLLCITQLIIFFCCMYKLLVLFVVVILTVLIRKVLFVLTNDEQV